VNILAQFAIPLTGLAILVATAFMGFIAFEVARLMWKGNINLTHLIAEANGNTSFSRFQMLLFTFVIASVYLVYALYGVTASSVPTLADLKLPDIPNGVLGLIGISGGSYIGSKVIQMVGDTSNGGQPAPQPQPAPPPQSTPVPPVVQRPQPIPPG
jgi:hypothetical protein